MTVDIEREVTRDGEIIEATFTLKGRKSVKRFRVSGTWSDNARTFGKYATEAYRDLTFDKIDRASSTAG